MTSVGSIGMGAFSAFKMVRESAVIYLWALWEAEQTMSLAVFLAQDTGNWEKVKEMAQWNKDNLVNPAISDSTGALSQVSFPINLAIEKGSKAMRQSMDFYIELAEENI